MPSFYTPNLTENTKNLTITDEEFHHISHVFRRKVGDEILLTNGAGILAEARITEIQKKQLSTEIFRISKKKKSTPEIAAAFPLLKNKHDAFIIEKLTELGIKEFYPIITDRTVRQASKNTVEKFEKIAIAAMKQCDNAYLPKIHKVQNLTELLDDPADYQPIVALEIGKHKTLKSILTEFSGKSICFIIGPEGGFSDKEIELFKEKKIPTFTLGNHILRAETAAIAVAAQIVGNLLENDRDYY
ncbi:MAG: 16S rRNA (uracil(1498)-N(3))-methyltransferase [Candidatus Cloacimonetes bacterium]|nr:16S rRNA (uracil(1498)-N(3))-methyltransferase [Candidatus Cloacimonadota bacterium]MCF7813360.1 16S rRNA (uracil(1498)-N(3))-methyltransferase [Candidatus Cloacimonadota bacterium]MCF7867849.1 16S rRNA (uracil(1498)-N(3))-methyltransferase [Candidatus Cloacimonadota bacterium]MCF7883265.1 16S rRNA (uracil(1498)-N(3))-methyltransferase [Candidatus Cloacimonadota bacterium]